jgi:hypothetical protein
MGRRPAFTPLRVYLNNRRIGTLSREANGAIGFTYAADWLAWDHALPVLLSLPCARHRIAVHPYLPSLKTCCLTRTSCAALSPKESAHTGPMHTACWQRSAVTVSARSRSLPEIE